MVVPRLGIKSSKPAYVLSWLANLPPKVKPKALYIESPYLVFGLTFVNCTPSYMARYKSKIPYTD